MNAIFNVVSMEEFKRISNVEVTHTTWNILQTMHEGIKAVKINKLQQLTSRFKSIRMADDETFDEFYAKLNDIVNSAFNLGEVFDQPKIVRKILRSLIDDFRPKVTTITESKDMDTIPIDELVKSLQSYDSDLPKTNKSKSMALKSINGEDDCRFDDEISSTDIAYLAKKLVGSLQSYESNLPKTNKFKFMALKSVNDVDDYGFDDEISSIEIAYLAKNFRNFLRNNNKMARNQNNANNKNVKKNEIT